ncbi:type VI secretion system tip protein VgrG [Vibrio sp. SS-MA-C1-2]|uniref:type VI secretion system Vgr family protein n=1 Tax=Vibrio sp. SS-MA-C1-2 TaxID=2908646 RepID=UPI001F3FEEC1|nr:type VI secretion system tip protein TssI/VgrG [Vibrio sp. SS-MA-C1-2]UJF17196.1 type VI secretion system tip protein VgrG [Vibrio sp. SS-MA-C1-2]
MNELLELSGSYLTVKDANNKEYVASKLKVMEALNGDYQWTVSAMSSSASAADWIGQQITTDVYDLLGDDRKGCRQYSGYVVKAERESDHTEKGYYSIRLTVKPWFYLLKYSKSSRVFQELSVQSIVTSIFDDLGFKGCYQVSSMPTTKRTYCIQFNESDFDFVTRLLSEEGVHFYFGKNDKNETLYLQTATNPFSKDGLTTLDSITSPTGEYEILDSWEPQHQFHTASVELTAYDYNQSKLVTSKTQKSKYSLSGNSKLTQTHYPVASLSQSYDDLAKPLAQTAIGQNDSNYSLINATTQSYQLVAGAYITLNSHFNSADKGNYIVIAVQYEFSSDSDNQFTTSASLTAIPEDQVFYPDPKSKPTLHGLQSAVVAGTTAGEPASDKMGRVRIKFHWDSETGDKTSCWVRVAQGMSGKSYGSQFLPRAGQEVLVSFIDGDPDRPVVVSSLYNSQNPPPYVTENTTQSGIKTKLSGESNELRFDDKKDNEELYLKAAKDFNTEVLNNETKTVAGDSTVAITKNLTHTIDETCNLTAKKDITIATDTNHTLTATESITEKTKTVLVEGSETITLKVGDSKLVISSSKIELSSSEIAISGSSKISLDGGSISQSGSSISLSSDGSLSAKAGSSMSLSASSSFSAKGTSGATIKGLNVTVQGDVGATLKGSATAEVSASGQTTVKGAIVMVN